MAKYNKSVLNKIIKLIESGVPNKYSSEASGISEATFYEWIKTKPEFSESIKKAESKRVASLVLQIRQDTSWQSKAWLLERTDRKIFHLQTQTENSFIEDIKDIREMIEKIKGSKVLEN